MARGKFVWLVQVFSDFFPTLFITIIFILAVAFFSILFFNCSYLWKECKYSEIHCLV